MSMQTTFIVEKTNTGFSAYANLLDGDVVATTGKDEAELITNALESLNLYEEHSKLPLSTSDDIMMRYEQ